MKVGSRVDALRRVVKVNMPHMTSSYSGVLVVLVFHGHGGQVLNPLSNVSFLIKHAKYVCIVV